MRARGLHLTAEIALGCRPGPLTGRISKQALNNLLLENGHARRYDNVTLADWEQD